MGKQALWDKTQKALIRFYGKRNAGTPGLVHLAIYRDAYADGMEAAATLADSLRNENGDYIAGTIRQHAKEMGHV